MINTNSKFSGFYSDLSPWLKLILSIGVVLLWFVFSSVIAAAILKVGDMSDWSYKIAQFVSSFGAFFIGSLSAAYLVSDNGAFRYFGMERLNGIGTFGMVIVTLVFMLPVVSYLAIVNQSIDLTKYLPESVCELITGQDSETERITIMMLSAASPYEFLFNMLNIAILPAIGEEMLFRGIIQGTLTKGGYNHHIVIWTVSIVFATIHMEFVGVLPRLMLSVVLGYMYYWSKSLWTNVLLHCVNNGISVVYAYMNPEELTKDPKTDFNVPESEIWISALCCFFAMSAFLYLFRLYAIQDVKIYENSGDSSSDYDGTDSSDVDRDRHIHKETETNSEENICHSENDNNNNSDSDDSDSDDSDGDDGD